MIMKYISYIKDVLENQELLSERQSISDSKQRW